MPGGPTLSTYFAASQRSRSPGQEDAALQNALALSEAEARLAQLSDEELIQRAIEASRAEIDEAVGGSSKRLRSNSPARQPGEAKEVRTSGDDDVTSGRVRSNSGPTFTRDAFSDKQQLISKFNASLDLVYTPGWIRKEERQLLREWMLAELAWHRVSYTSPRSKQKIVTPRFTATFGKDDTGAPDSAYPVKPKPIPPLLHQLQDELQKRTGSRFNAIIINFYQDGKDSISYHADDESFLGPLPTIASLSLGSSRDFYLRRKFGEDTEPSRPQFNTKGSGPAASRPTEKMRLGDGDLLVMKGRTQAEWEHSIPKRADAGPRINLTFRRVISVTGTNNFQRYNRGLPTDDNTQPYRWDARQRAMVPGSGGI